MLKKAFDGEVYYWYEDGNSRQAKSRVTKSSFERPHAPSEAGRDVMTNEKVNPQMDWQQVVLNGGPPCFALAGDLDTHYCGRAERWAGHDSHHKFVSLDDLLATVCKEEREAAWQPIGTAPKDGTSILRPHSIWGAMAVRYKPREINGVEFEWLNSDYGTAWPDGAFLPYWMPLPAAPTLEAVLTEK